MKTCLPTLILTLLFLLNHPLFAQQFDWAGNMGGTSDEYGRSVATDDSGYVYITGFFKGTADFDPGTTTANLTSSGGFDVFIVKMDPSGDLIWAQSIGGTSNEYSYTIATDSAGNVYTAGRFEGTADFDPGSGTLNHTAAGSSDIFVLKLDAAGDLAWAASMGGTATDQINSIAADQSGSIYATGVYNGTADFDPDTGTHNLTAAGGQEVFVLKLDAAGHLQWAGSMGGSGHDRSYSIAIDQAGNSYTTGIFSGSADFDPGTGSYSLTSAGFYDAFILKLNDKGNFVWARDISGSSYDFGYGITTDNFGHVYTTGYFRTTADFDPGTGTYNLTSAGNYDIFLHKMDTAGNFKWARHMGGISDDRGYSVAADKMGDVYLTGYFIGTVDFDPSPNTLNITSAGNADFYVYKSDSSGQFLWVQQMGGVNHDFGLNLMIDPGDNIYITGNYEGKADFDPDTLVDHYMTPEGGSDVFVLKLNSCHTGNSITVSACDSYTSPSGNHVWSADGQYKDTLINSAGCDSILTIELIIHQSITLHAQDSICRGDSLFVGGQFQTMPGTYTDSFKTTPGCDSIVVTTLSFIHVDTMVVQSMPDLTANLAGAGYRWLNCDSNFIPVPGATQQTFTPVVSGNYAVEITSNGCVDTSSCHFVNVTGIEQLYTGSGFKIYPVPVVSDLSLEFEDVQEELIVYLFTEEGKQVYSDHINGKQSFSIDMKNLPPGIYLLRIKTSEGILVKKVVKVL